MGTNIVHHINTELDSNSHEEKFSHKNTGSLFIQVFLKETLVSVDYTHGKFQGPCTNFIVLLLMKDLVLWIGKT